MKDAFLILADGTVFKGKQAGDFKETLCELVFETSVTGYIEALTSPSYMGQGIVMSYPMAGNYGFSKSQMESDHAAAALIVREVSECASNFTSEGTLLEFLKEQKITCITEIDTRSIVRHLRESGTMNAVITDVPAYDLETIRAFKPGAVYTSSKSYKTGEGKPVAVVDFGVNKSTVSALVERGFSVSVYPADTAVDAILSDKPCFVYLSEGPGDPQAYLEYLPAIKAILDSGVSVFAAGLSHQLVALALGGKTEKLKAGHRGSNQPVKDMVTERVVASSQNHGYVVDKNALPTGAVVEQINLNDDSVEGLVYNGGKIRTVQFSPDINGSGQSLRYIFDRFLDQI